VVVDSADTAVRNAFFRRRWLIIALVNFLCAALLGTLLRFAFVEEIRWIQYKNVLHAHSHVAMLGWVFLALYALLIHGYGTPAIQRSGFYRTLFWVIQISVIGMLVSFPIQGYGPISITFSTLHVLCAYLFVYRFWRDLSDHRDVGGRFVRTALIFMVVSTCGLMCIGPMMAMGLRGSAVFYMAVQFYLHFQFNGWFLFAILGIFFGFLEANGISLPSVSLRRFYILLVVSCILTYALAVAWSQPYLSIFLLNSAGVVVQLMALLIFLTLIWPRRREILGLFARIPRLFISLACIAFIAKIVMQSVLVFPSIARAGYTIRNYVIGFMHLILLGVVTAFILAYSLQQKQLQSEGRLAKVGLWLILVGFTASEALLFLQGTLFWAAMGFLPAYYVSLFCVSALIPLGVLCFLLSQISSLRQGPITD